MSIVWSWSPLMLTGINFWLGVISHPKMVVSLRNFYIAWFSVIFTCLIFSNLSPPAPTSLVLGLLWFYGLSGLFVSLFWLYGAFFLFFKNVFSLVFMCIFQSMTSVLVMSGIKICSVSFTLLCVNQIKWIKSQWFIQENNFLLLFLPSFCLWKPKYLLLYRPLKRAYLSM